MKNFITNNWFRMVIGTSTLIFSVGFFIRSITPSYATNPNNTSNVVSTNGYAEGNYVYFIDNGIMYQIQKGDLHMTFKYGREWSNWWEEKRKDGLEDPITGVKRKYHFDYNLLPDFNKHR
jgi:hypothetical protein